MSDRYRLMVPVTVPPLLIAAVGLSHPSPLTVEMAEHWQLIHTILLFLFPLVALGPWLVARRGSPAAAVVVGVVAYVYATAYTALDVLAGIAGGAIKAAEAGGLGIIFPVAANFELVGGVALVLASALSVGIVSRALGWWVVPGGVLVIASAWLHWQAHVYPPRGVLSMVGLAAGWGLLAWQLTRPGVAARDVARRDRTVTTD
ncbi:hypothetical protein GCM10009821_21860 [Aeromicrobium halocynthiae]|uniref:DUF4386 family protein n=1 Tax=Aeromicrobium halocynthiae TaxID=560557 RepID=A0ABN2W2I5_9ACTN